jgi:hypothetical protein
MYLISYRGNINEPTSINENRPYDVTEALKQGFHCWVDVWFHEGRLYLGSNEPKYVIKPTFVNIFSLWCNAMNFETLLELRRVKAVNYFQYRGTPTLTNRDYIISDKVIEGYEKDTIIFTNDPVYKELPFKGIISPTISELVDV